MTRKVGMRELNQDESEECDKTRGNDDKEEEEKMKHKHREKRGRERDWMDVSW